MLTILSILLLQCCAGILAAPTAPPKLQVTAITGVNGQSAFQCWEISDPWVVSTDSGLAGNYKLKGVDAGTYVAIKPYYDGKLHQAPIVQYVFSHLLYKTMSTLQQLSLVGGWLIHWCLRYVNIVSGLMHLTLPNSKDEAWVPGGTKDSLILAADTVDVSSDGHRTEYVGTEEFRGVGLRVASGAPPVHTVVHKGPCHWHRQKPAWYRN